MRDLAKTKIEGRIYLFPVPVVKERKYLIFCASDEEADLVSEFVRTKKMTHPDLVSEFFVYLTMHTDKQTKIFVPNPEAKLL